MTGRGWSRPRPAGPETDGRALVSWKLLVVVVLLLPVAVLSLYCTYATVWRPSIAVDASPLHRSRFINLVEVRFCTDAAVKLAGQWSWDIVVQPARSRIDPGIAFFRGSPEPERQSFGPGTSRVFLAYIKLPPGDYGVRVRFRGLCVWSVIAVCEFESQWINLSIPGNVAEGKFEEEFLAPLRAL